MSESPFQISLKKLPTHCRIDVPPVFVANALSGMPIRDALEAPKDDPDAGAGTAELDLYADGSHVFAAGTVKGWLTVACSRCVAPVKVPLEEVVRVTFMPQTELRGASAVEENEDVELAEDDLDVFPYQGDAVDLEPLVREQFVLAVPFAPLCREDCKGLCPQCGVDRNTTKCDCESPIDPRFAALKNLKPS